MAIIKFSTMDLGTYDTSVVVSAVTQTNTANNKPMVKITISDGDDTITAIQFDTTKADLAYAGIEEGVTACLISRESLPVSLLISEEGVSSESLTFMAKLFSV